MLDFLANSYYIFVPITGMLGFILLILKIRSQYWAATKNKLDVIKEKKGEREQNTEVLKNEEKYIDLDLNPKRILVEGYKVRILASIFDTMLLLEYDYKRQKELKQRRIVIKKFVKEFNRLFYADLDSSINYTIKNKKTRFTIKIKLHTLLYCLLMSKVLIEIYYFLWMFTVFLRRFNRNPIFNSSKGCLLLQPLFV